MHQSGELLSMSCEHPFYSQARCKISKSFLQNDVSFTGNLMHYYESIKALSVGLHLSVGDDF